MSDADKNEQAHGERPSLRMIGCTLLLGLVLAWPALVRGGAFYFPDAKGYVNGGSDVFQVLHALGGAAQDADGAGAVIEEVSEDVVGLRSLTYSVFAYLMFVASDSLLTLTLVQALLTAMLVMIFLRAVLCTVTPRGIVGLILLLGAATSAPWYASFAMPDIFGAATILGVLLLAVYGDRLYAVQRVYVLALVAFAVSAHTSNMLLAVPMTLAGTLVIWRRSRKVDETVSLKMYGWVTAPILLGVGATIAIGALGFGEPSAVPKRYPFILARSVADGPARWHLEKHCDDYRYAVCDVFAEIPETVQAFLWGPEGLRQNATPEQMERIRAEEWLIVRRAVMAYPYTQLAKSAGNGVKQLLLFGAGKVESGVTMTSDANGRPVGLRSTRIHDAVIVVVDYVVYAVVIIAAVGTVLLWIRGRLGDHDKQAVGLLMVGIVANAFICGVLSAPVHRYQGRVIWLLPLLFALVLLHRCQAKLRNPPDAHASSRQNM